jgi:hypothetical protein
MAASTAPDAMADEPLDLDVASCRFTELLAQVGKAWG